MIRMSNNKNQCALTPACIFQYFLLGALLVIVAGCASGPKASRLYHGMSQADVVAVLGAPDGYAAEAGYTVLRYANELTLDPPSHKSDYFVVLKDGAVAGYGIGDVIEQRIGGIVTVFLHRY